MINNTCFINSKKNNKKKIKKQINKLITTDLYQDDKLTLHLFRRHHEAN